MPPRPPSKRAGPRRVPPIRRAAPGRRSRALPPDRAAARAAVRQSASDVYRDAIIAAAKAEFTDRGYAATKMIDVARRAGMSVGALYRHFDSKEAIFASLMGHDGQQVVERMREVAATVAAPGERLPALLSCALSFIQDNRAMFLVFNQLSDTDRASCHALVDHAGSIREQIFALYRDALADGVAAGTLRADVSIDDQLNFFTGAVHGFIEHWIRSGGDSRLADKASLIAGLTLRALRAPGGPS